jgi:glycosyltransferase AglD
MLSHQHRITHHAPQTSVARCAFSIIVPAYNEQLVLEETVERIVRLLGDRDDYEIVIVEDGCSDYTPVIAASLRDRYPNVQHIHSRVRLGKGRAVAEGMRVARGDVVVLMDADMATDPSALLRHVRAVQAGEADIIVGSRYHAESRARRTLVRLLYSRAYNLAARVLLRSRIADHQCGFKVFDAAAMRNVLPFVKSDRFFWDTEVLAIAQWFGYRVREAPIAWREGKASKVRMLRTPFEMFGAMIVLAIMRRWRLP